MAAGNLYSRTLPNAIFTDRKAPHKSNSAQVAVEHKHCHPYNQGSPAESQSPVHWEMIGRSPRPTPAAFVIAQQYSYATFVSQRFHCRKQMVGAVFKNVTISVF